MDVLGAQGLVKDQDIVAIYGEVPGLPALLDLLENGAECTWIIPDWSAPWARLVG